ncbi:hypothetical protein D9M73_204330 [compost metagenome]
MVVLDHLAFLEAELDGDLVSLAANALLTAGKNLEDHVAAEAVGGSPLRDRDALALEFGAGFIRGTEHEGSSPVCV